jgi:hypothetical protein
MAVAVATLTVDAYPNGVDNTQQRQVLNGICALSGPGVNTYPANGVPLPWTSMVDGNAGGRFLPQTTKTQPIVAFFFSKQGNAASGNLSYAYDQTHDTLRIFTAGTELGAVAIPADTIGFEAEYVRGV